MEKVENVIKDLIALEDTYERIGNPIVASLMRNAIQTIRDLQEQISKMHIVADGDFPKYPSDDVLAYVKGIGFDSSKSSWMVGYFTENNKWFRSHGMQYLVNGEKTSVIAWMELPKFEEVE